MLQHPKNTTKVVPITLPKDYVDTAPTSTDNIGVDTRGWRFARFDIISGALTGGTSWTATLQQSSDNGSTDTYANVESTPATTVATFTASDDGEVHSLIVDLHAAGLERYLKLAWAKSGTFTASALAATCTLSGPNDTALATATEVDGIYPA